MPETQDQLAALDRAATQALAAVKRKPGDGSLIDAYIKAAGAYHAELERLHRTGKLVLIDDGAVERAGFAIWHKLGQIESNVRAGQLTKDEVHEIATAALAALGVK